MQAQTVRQKLDIRRAVTSSAFVMMLMVAVMGLFALFSMWSINRAWTEGMTRSGELRQLSIASLEAQVAFKVQVQEWKNILLRGDDPALFTKHHDAFAKEADAARTLLANVAEQAKALGFSEDGQRAADLVTAHHALTDSYEQTLSEVKGASPVLSAEAAHTIDVKLRGVDRNLEAGIGKLATDIGAAADAKRAELIGGMGVRYRTLRLFIISVIVGALAVTAFVLFGLLRATR